MPSRRLIITAPRGSGGSYTHLTEVLPRLMKLRPGWDIELHASPEVLRASFGSERASWMRLLPSGSYADWLRWEFVDLPRLLRQDREALVWAPFGPALNIALARRAVWMSRNIIPLLPIRQWEVSRADRPRLRAMKAVIVLWARFARRTICVSHDARARLAKLASVDPARIPVIAHGVASVDERILCSTPELEALRSEPYLLHVGQPMAYRRTKELFRAYSEVALQRPDLPPLVVAGAARGPDASYERECLKSLDSAIRSNRARMLGHVHHADVLSLMAKAHAFLYPSVHENCPNVVLEALAAGRVGVYADIPTVRELADDAGVFVRDGGLPTLAEAIERAAFDQAARADIARRALARAPRFTWELTAEHTATVLDEVFAG